MNRSRKKDKKKNHKEEEEKKRKKMKNKKIWDGEDKKKIWEGEKEKLEETEEMTGKRGWSRRMVEVEEVKEKDEEVQKKEVEKQA